MSEGLYGNVAVIGIIAVCIGAIGGGYFVGFGASEEISVLNTELEQSKVSLQQVEQELEDKELEATLEASTAKNYCRNQLDLKNEENEELLEAGENLFFDFLDCTWAFSCSQDMAYCLNEADFTESEIRSMEIVCELPPSWKESVRVFATKLNIE